MKFILNGCDISFFVEASDDITLKQLISQCDKIEPDWCACGICSYEKEGFPEDVEPEIIIGYDSVTIASPVVPCSIIEENDKKHGKCWDHICSCHEYEEY